MATPRFRRLGAALWLSVSVAELPAAPLLLEDFETPSESIQFSAGVEFPGASGRFERIAAAAYEGGYGGRLHFDFTGGGHYVGLIFQPSQTPGKIAREANALEGWVRRPMGHDLVFRYTDNSGQTFQKPVACVASEWTRVIIPFEGWSQHWGGPDDGQVHGGPIRLALLVESGATEVGQVDFDDLRLVRQSDATVRLAFPAQRFLPGEGWQLRAHGAAGSSRLAGRILRLDYTQGADGFSLVPPDRTLPGNVDRILLRVFGSGRDLPVRLVLRTHFMNFHRSWGTLTGDGHLELGIEGPPSPGWQWFGGEDDGELHGPLRIGEIRFERPPKLSIIELELEEIVLSVSCPTAKRCLVSASVVEDAGESMFEFTARALTVESILGVLHWELRSWEGEIIDRGTRELEVPPQVTPVSVTLPIPRTARERLKFLEAEFRLEASGQDVPPVQAAWVAPLEDKGSPALQPDSPFGMGAYLHRYPAGAEGFSEMERAAAFAQAAGVKWSREEFQWSRIEPRRGEFQWDLYDRLVATARRHGIQVYAIAGYWSGWTQPYTAEGIADYVHYLEALVRRYREDIHQWEIWNEPNIFFWPGPKDLYADLLKQSYAAVKAIDPTAEILGLSTAGIDFDYIRHMVELDAPFDILTVHPYRKTLNDRAFLADLQRATELVRHRGGEPRPVWVTELGWSTYSPHNTLRQSFAPTTLRAQAELIVRCYLLAITSGIDPRIFWYNFRNDGADPFYFEHHMGIMDHRFNPKPAYRTFAVLTRILDRLKPVNRLELGTGTMAWTFAQDGAASRRVTAVWNPREDSEVAVPVRAGRIRRVNAVGESTAMLARDGQIDLQLRRGAVVYLVE